MVDIMERSAVHTDLIARFEQVARESPDRLAVAGPDGEATFAGLESQSRALAGELARHGIGRGDSVAVHLPRGYRLLAALLGIWRVGAAYVPLDAAYPLDRLAFMAAEAGVGVMLTAPDSESTVRIPGVQALDAMELLRQRDEDASASLPQAPETSPLDLAYTIFTSGSTGRPKGVMVPRGAVTALVAALETFGAYPATPRVVAWNASVAFDASVQQWVRVCRGDTVVVLGIEERTDPDRLNAALGRYAVTDLDLTPSHWELLREVLLRPRADGRTLRLFVGGEPIPEGTWKELAEVGELKTLEALNVYGPTECTVDTTATWIRGEHPHIGQALYPSRCVVLDVNLRPVEAGAEGELYIAGPQVARGYANRAALTAERFLPDPFGAAGSRMYRTGDMVRLTEQGDLEFRGRTDRQVKLRGFRIDLDEIEAVLNSHPGVTRAIVQVRDLDASGGRLLAHFVASGEPTPSSADLRKFAAQSLPDFMVPADILPIDRFPLTPNGKSDLAALPEPADSSLGELAPAQPGNPIGALIAEVWAGVLGRDRVDPEENFFALGGHSLMALRVMARLKKDLGVSIALQDIYRNPKLSELASFVQSKTDGSAGTTGTEQ